MGANYDLRKRPSGHLGDQQKDEWLYARLKSKGTISFDELIQKIEQSSGIKRSDIVAVMSEIEDTTTRYLKDGYHVQIGQFGYLSAKLKSRPVEQKNDIRAESVIIDNVNFRPSAWLRKNIKGPVERASIGFVDSEGMPVHERMQVLNDFLEHHPYVSRTDYTELTGLRKYKASLELNRLVEDGILVLSGKGTHKVYAKK
jgi:predicted histone-like DNA-binding protein